MPFISSLPCIGEKKVLTPEQDIKDYSVATDHGATGTH